MADQAASSGPAAKPSARDVEDFHTNADTNVRPESIHHTLGPSPSQSSPGDHNHKNDGKSVPLMEGETITGAKGGNTALASVIAVLVKYGAIDSTT